MTIKLLSMVMSVLTKGDKQPLILRVQVTVPQSDSSTKGRKKFVIGKVTVVEPVSYVSA